MRPLQRTAFAAIMLLLPAAVMAQQALSMHIQPAKTVALLGALKTLTHLDFPHEQPLSDRRSSWDAFWFTHEQTAQAYGPYECADRPQPVRLQ